MSLYSSFRQTAEKYKNNPAVYFKRNNSWQSFNYSQFLMLVDNLAGGFKKLGIAKDNRVAILSENRPEWAMSDLAINKIGAVSVPIHTSSNFQAIEYLLQDSGSKFLIISEIYLEKIEKLKPELRNIKIIIIRKSLNEKKISGAEDFDKHEFNDLLEVSGDKEIIENEISSIVYTSGTTGEPKGVMLSNENFLSNINAASEIIKILPTDKFLSFLPLSHVLERTCGNYVPLFHGASIAYAEGMKQLSNNLKEINPTIIVCVPKIFERTYEKITSTVEESSEFRKKVFYWALRQRKGFKYFIAYHLALKKIKNAFGNNIRFAVSGGASLNIQLMKFFRHIGIDIIEGYGLTETSPIIALNPLGKPKVGSVGIVIPGTTTSIAEDKEILVKGPGVMKGYWNKEAQTKEALDDNGWFRTGDLGFLDKEGYLTIIGRKKEIIVTSNGKKVPPEKVESIINLNPFISQSVVVGHRKNFLACLAVPNFENINKTFGSTADINEILTKEFERINKGLMDYERIEKFSVIVDPFTIEDGDLTATLKVRRSIIEKKYEKKIEEMYGR